MGNKKPFRNWNLKKIETDTKIIRPQFKIREIFWARIGKNIGFEQNGKGESFLRPVLVFKKFNNEVFWGIPLTTAKKTGKYYFDFEFIHSLKSIAVLSQMRLFDSRHLERKMGTISQKDFLRIKKAIQEIVNDS